MSLKFEQIGPGFWNARDKFKILGGLVDVGNHMSLVKLSSGKFVAIDALDLSKNTTLKDQLDQLTDNGALLEAVITTHPFHTVGIQGFFACYPYIAYYGCPRHLRNFTNIPWAGSLADCKVQVRFEPDVCIKIPPTDAVEFDDPKPPMRNHLSNAFVYHKESKTVHNDDCVIYIDSPFWKMGTLAYLAGARHDSMKFHPSLKTVGLRRTAEAPRIFMQWFEKMLDEWDIERFCTAHNGVCSSNSSQRLRELAQKSKPMFEQLSIKFATEQADGVLLNPDEEYSTDQSDILTRERGTCECG